MLFTDVGGGRMRGRIQVQNREFTRILDENRCRQCGPVCRGIQAWVAGVWELPALALPSRTDAKQSRRGCNRTARSARVNCLPGAAPLWRSLPLARPAFGGEGLGFLHKAPLIGGYCGLRAIFDV
jgi:hypothetical protein